MIKTVLGLLLLLPMTEPQQQTFTVSGTVKLSGEVPKPKPNKALANDPACAAHHKDDPLKEDLVVDASGGVRWAFVYIKKGVQGQFNPPAEALLIDQVGCTYVPHMAGVMTGQVVNFRNSDPMLHNVNILTFANKPMNFGQVQNAVTAVKFANQEVMIKAACNVHPFMASHIGVLEHPFFAVTDAAGKFEIKNLPPGNYTLAVWHERLGKEEREIVVKAALSETFTFNMK